MQPLHKRSAQHGFTLIELMIVLAIVAILFSIAIPGYRDYTTRAKVSELLAVSAPARLTVSETVTTEGSVPATLSLTTVTTRYVQAVTWDEGQKAIKVTGGGDDERIRGKYLQLKPTLTEQGNLTWDCAGTFETRFLPRSCAPLPGI